MTHNKHSAMFRKNIKKLTGQKYLAKKIQVETCTMAQNGGEKKGQHIAVNFEKHTTMEDRENHNQTTILIQQSKA